jgi:hypothetical protein
MDGTNVGPCSEVFQCRNKAISGAKKVVIPGKGSVESEEEPILLLPDLPVIKKVAKFLAVPVGFGRI